MDFHLFSNVADNLEMSCFWVVVNGLSSALYRGCEMTVDLLHAECVLHCVFSLVAQR